MESFFSSLNPSARAAKCTEFAMKREPWWSTSSSVLLQLQTQALDDRYLSPMEFERKAGFA